MEKSSAPADLVKKAGQIIFLKIKKYNFAEVEKILNSDYPVDHPVTDTQMSSFSFACSLQVDGGEQETLNT